MSEPSTFAHLSQIAPSIDKKGKLSYVSWPEAWARVKEFDPEAAFEWHPNERGALGIADERAVWAHVSVTIKGQTLAAWLPCMDHKNKAIAPDAADGMDINKAYQRAQVKAIALHGMGLHVYMGEDLPAPPPDAPLSSSDLRTLYAQHAQPKGLSPEEFKGKIDGFGGIVPADRTAEFLATLTQKAEVA